jgi:hypothetical protein
MQIASDSGPDKYFEVFYLKNPIKLLILRGVVVYDKNKTALENLRKTSHGNSPIRRDNKSSGTSI